MLTPSDMKAATKAVSTAQAGLTKAQNQLKAARGSLHVAQTESAKAAAEKEFDKALAAVDKASARLVTAKNVLAAKTKAYQSGKKFNVDDVDLPF